MLQKILTRLILPGALLVMGIMYYSDQSEGMAANSESATRAIKERQRAEVLEQSILTMHLNDRFLVDGSLFLKGSNFTSATLRTLSAERPKLVFRYNYRQCDECINLVLAKIKRLEAIVGKQNILVISSHRSEREFKIMSEYRKIHEYAYHIPDNALNLPAEKQNIPFLFILTEDLRVSHGFVPLKEFPDQIDQFFSIVTAKYFKDRKSVNIKSRK